MAGIRLIGKLLDILHLLAHLFDQHLELDGAASGFSDDGAQPSGFYAV